MQIEPSTETETLVAAIRTDSLSAGVREPKTTEDTAAPPHNLPTQATLFIGRQAELTALDAFLSDGNTRLVTITGPGGIGKTRLALAAAERQQERQNFRHGVFFVPLAGIDDSERIVSAVAAAMEIRLERGEAQLLKRLRTKQQRLLLDNFEQVMDGGVVVTRLLQAAPRLQILVTSRERLRLQGEQLYPIQGLSEAETLGQNESLQLFLQAARRVQPNFEPTAENAAALHQICRLVEGMPLALELAAAWVDLLTPREIAAEIQCNLDFLASDLRNIHARHGSMQAVFDVSWQRLSPGEQRLLAQVTVFRNGFTREAVAAVTQASLHDLAVLVNKSLLNFNGDNGRYHIHGLLRQYAAAQLEADTALRDRHCDYYCKWMGVQADRLHGPKQMIAVYEIQADLDNVHTAVSHALQQEQSTDLVAALFNLTEYYRVRGQRQEGIKFYQPIYDVLNNQPDLTPFILFWTTMWLGEFHGVLDQFPTFETFQQQAKMLLEMPFFQRRDTRAERAAWLHQEGYRLIQRDPTASVQLFRQSQDLIQTLDNQAWLARNLIGLARAARNVGDLDLARDAMVQSFSLFQALGNPLRQIEARILMGNLATVAGHYDEAERWLHEGIAQLRHINHPELLGLGLWYLGTAQMFNGRFEAALQTNQERQRVDEELDNPSRARLFEAQIRLHLGEYEQSAMLGQEALRAAQTIKENRIVNEGLRLLGILALVKGDSIEALARLKASENLVQKGRLWTRFFSNQNFFGLVATIEEETAVAQQYIIQAIQEAVEQQIEVKLAASFAVAACLNAVQEEPEQAITLYALAQQHPFVANSRWFADVIGNRVTAAAATLPPEVVTAAQARGQAMDLWETAELLL
ncbi:MAG: hypothetical protein GY796_14130 [Chloroflexi bacterium]|nr:hypothetical protein [Chloroflexota bacterium]